MLVVYVLENMLPLDKVAYYFDALSPALTTFLWYAGVAVMWGFFLAAEIHGETYTSAIKVFVWFVVVIALRGVADRENVDGEPARWDVLDAIEDDGAARGDVEESHWSADASKAVGEEPKVYQDRDEAFVVV